MDTKLEEFLKKEVNVSPEQISQASTSHTYIRSLLANKKETDNKFPWIIDGDFLSGSYARGTKLFPLDEADGGGMAYARIFNCISGSGTNIDTHDFNPIQRYVINNYYRYLKGLQKGKNLLIPFNINSRVKTWKTLIANDGNGDEKYYISGINGIDLAQQIAEIEGIKLIEAV